MNSSKLRLILSRFTVSRSIVPFIILLSLGITIPLAYFLNIATDEAYSLHTTNGDLVYTIKQAIFFEFQPPLYFLLLNIWRSLWGTIFFARLFSVLCIGTTIFITSKLSCRYLKKIHPGWISSFAALNPFVIWAALEVRCYALVILLSALILLFFYDGYLSPSASSKARWIYVLFSILALYTQYYLGFLLIANMIALLISRRWQASLAYILGMIIVGISFIPMLLFLQHQVSSSTVILKNQLSILAGTKYLYWRIQDYILFLPFDLRHYHFITVIYDWIFRFAIVAAMILFAKKHRFFIDEVNIAVLSIFGALFLCFFFLITQLLPPDFFQMKHTAVLFLPLLLALLVWFANTLGRTVLVSCIIFYFIFNLTALFVTYRPMAKSGDHARVASYIEYSNNLGRPIIVYPANNALPLQFYYSGPGIIVPIPRERRFDTYDVHDYVLQNENDIFKALSRAPNNHNYFWLVQGNIRSIGGVDLNRKVLHDFIRKNCSILHSKNFYAGTKVSLLHLRNRP